MIKKKITLKKKVEVTALKTFIIKYKYILVFNDLSLNTAIKLDELAYKNNISFYKTSIKSKILLKMLNFLHIEKSEKLEVKGPIVLIGVSEIYDFKLLLSSISTKTSNELDLIGVITKQKLFEKKELNFMFKFFFSNISVFEYYNLINLKTKNEILKFLTLSTYKLESLLMSKLKF